MGRKKRKRTEEGRVEIEVETEAKMEARRESTAQYLEEKINELICKAGEMALDKIDYTVEYGFETKNPDMFDQIWAVQLMGSQAYGLATEDSDFDFVLPLTDAAAAHAKEIRQEFMRMVVNTGIASKTQLRHEMSNETVKWRNPLKECQVSLNVSHRAKTSSALVVTAWLRMFYRGDYAAWRKAVMDVATTLRQKKHMSTGKMPVGDTLKSPAMALICAALIAEKGGETEPSAAFLYRHLLLFDAASSKIVVDLDIRSLGSPQIKIDRRVGCENQRDALLVTAEVASRASGASSSKKASGVREELEYGLSCERAAVVCNSNGLCGRVAKQQIDV